MLFRKETLVAGFLAASVAAIAGCSVHHDYDGGGTEVVPAGYADDPYYDQGTYEGDYWVWHDREGHSHREGRAEHERRGEMRYQNRSSDSGHRDGGDAGYQRDQSARINNAGEQQRAQEQQRTQQEQRAQEQQRAREQQMTRQQQTAREQQAAREQKSTREQQTRQQEAARNQNRQTNTNGHSQEEHPSQAGGRNSDQDQDRQR